MKIATGLQFGAAGLECVYVLGTENEYLVGFRWCRCGVWCRYRELQSTKGTLHYPNW